VSNNNNNTKKPRIHHLHKGYTEDGKWTPQHTQAVKAADSIFNSPSTAKPTFTKTEKKIFGSPLPEKQNIKRPPKKRK
jgi:hypothetical protein